MQYIFVSLKITNYLLMKFSNVVMLIRKYKDNNEFSEPYIYIVPIITVFIVLFVLVAAFYYI